MPPKEEKRAKSPDEETEDKSPDEETEDKSPEEETEVKRRPPPPAWQLGEEDQKLAIKYWKSQTTSAKREITRRSNQVKTLRKQRKKSRISFADLQKLTRWGADLRHQLERGRNAAEELFVLCDGDAEFKKIDADLGEIQKNADEALDSIDELMSGPSGDASAPIPKVVEGTGVEDDDEDAISVTSVMSGNGNQYLQMMSVHYDITKEVTKFDGEHIEEFENWLTQWSEAEKKLTRMEKTPAEKLLALKRCLKGRALEYIRHVRDGEHANFEGAKQMLIEYYLDKNVTGKVLVDQLLALEPMGKEVSSIENVLFKLRTNWESIQGLSLTGDQGQTLLFCCIAETKMSPFMRNAWAKKVEQLADPTHPIGHTATEKDLFELLSSTIKRQRRTATNPSKGEKREEKKEEKKENRQRQTIQGSFSAQQPQRTQEGQKCPVCEKSGHAAPECRTLINLKSPQERQKFLEEKRVGVCYNCLKGKHVVKDCKKPSQCGIGGCSKKHHSLLHFGKQARQTYAAAATKTEPKEEGKPMVAAATASPIAKTPILQTCRAWVKGPGGTRQLARIFLDSGSEVTLMRRDLASQLGLEGPSHTLSLVGVGGVPIPSTKEKIVTFRLQSLKGDYQSGDMKALTKESLTEKIREVKVDTSKFDHLRGLEFADEIPRKATEVDVLIGVDYYGALVTGGVIQGKPDEPVALQTKLGFILSGAA
jgi:hypothetical protein